MPGWILTVVAVSGNTLVIYLIATNRRLRTTPVDRYVAIVMPFKYVPIMTSQCIVAMVILSWLFPAVLYFLIAVILKQIASEDIFIIFKISTVFVFQLMPCIFLLVTTMQMFYIAYKHTKMMATLALQLQFNHPMTLNKRKKGVEISSARFIGVVVFVTALLPGVVVFVFAKFQRDLSTFKSFDLSVYLTIIPRARMSSESIAHEAEAE